jgi:hypothetical protein
MRLSARQLGNAGKRLGFRRGGEIEAGFQVAAAAQGKSDKAWWKLW